MMEFPIAEAPACPAIHRGHALARVRPELSEKADTNSFSRASGIGYLVKKVVTNVGAVTDKVKENPSLLLRRPEKESSAGAPADTAKDKPSFPFRRPRK